MGETLAALEAVASRELAPLPALLSAWSVIAHDEPAHAELASSFVGWALAQDRGDLGEAVRRTFDAAFATELSAAVLSATSEESLEVLGILSARARHVLRRRAVEGTLRPAAASLCGMASRMPLPPR